MFGFTVHNYLMKNFAFVSVIDVVSAGRCSDEINHKLIEDVPYTPTPRLAPKH